MTKGKSFFVRIITFSRNITLCIFALYLTSFNPLSYTDKKKRDDVVISTNGFYYTRSGLDGYLYAIKENGKHKRDRDHRKTQLRYR